MLTIRVDTKAFKSGDSVAVRLPVPVAYEVGTELDRERDGEVVTLRPKKTKVQLLFESLRKLPCPTVKEIRAVRDIPERTRF